MHGGLDPSLLRRRKGKDHGGHGPCCAECREWEKQHRLPHPVPLLAVTAYSGTGKTTLARLLVGLLEPIRKAFAKANGVKPALFSANSEGACPACNGAGVIYTDLGMMAGVSSTCDACEGKRFQPAVLEHRLGGRNRLAG